MVRLARKGGSGAPWLIVLLALAGCESSGTEPEASGVPELALFDTGRDDFVLVGTHEDGAVFGGALDPETGLPDQAVLWTAEGHQLEVRTDETGMPREMVIGDLVFLFANVTASEADVAVVLPDGSIHIARQVEYTAFQPALAPFSAALVPAAVDSEDIIRWAIELGTVMGIASCAVAAAGATGLTGAAPLVGPAAFAAGAGCAGAVVSILREVDPPESLVAVVGAETIDLFSTAAAGAACAATASPRSCVEALAAAASQAGGLADDTRRAQERARALAEAALRTETGDVQVTLTWDNEADLDLWVTDPAGERIGFSNPTSSSGGRLDVDDTDGFGPENIFWPTNQAPPGTYRVEVHYYDGPAPIGYSVLISAVGQEVQKSGLFTADEIDVFHDLGTFTINTAGEVSFEGRSTRTNVAVPGPGPRARTKR